MAEANVYCQREEKLFVSTEGSEISQNLIETGSGIEATAVDDAGAHRLGQTVEGFGGHALVLRAPLDFRARVATFHPMAKGLEALAARLRNAFDPQGVLNPNRLSREPR